MTLTKIGASLSGGADLVTITQSSHGFTVGKVLKSSGSNGAYTTAQANTAANAEVIGIVIQVIDTNTFTMALSGRITVDGAVPDVTAGSVLFLSGSSAGDLTSTEPTTAGHISKPVAVVTTANSEMLMVNYRGEVISTATESWDTNGAELILDVDGDTSIHANTDDQIDVQISGADDFRFSANTLNVLSGSTLSIDSGATISNSGTLVGFNSNSFTVTQSSHGLSVGKVVKSSGSNGAFATAQADSAANAEVVGIVTVVNGNDITIVTSGEVDVAAAVPNVAASTVVFLDPSNAGDLTATEPSTAGQISKPIAIVTNQNSKMVLLPFRGEVIGSNTAAIADDAVTTAKIADDAVTTAKILDANVTLAKMASQSVDEDNLYISNAGNNGEFLSKQSGNNGGLTWAAVSSGPSQAIQSAIEAETNQDTYIPPDLMKYHPGVAKVWIRFYQSNSSHTMGASYGVASIADGGAAGFSDFTWSTAFSSAEYAILASAEAASVAGMEAGSKAAGTVTVRFWDMNGTYNDALHASVACFGEL